MAISKSPRTPANGKTSSAPGNLSAGVDVAGADLPPDVDALDDEALLGEGVPRELVAQKRRREKAAEFLGCALVTKVYRFRDPDDSRSPKFLCGKIETTAPHIPDGDDLGKKFGPGLYLLLVCPTRPDGTAGAEFWMPLERVDNDYSVAPAGAVTLAPGASAPVVLSDPVRQSLALLREHVAIQGELRLAGGNPDMSEILKSMTRSMQGLMTAQENMLNRFLSGRVAQRSLEASAQDSPLSSLEGMPPFADLLAGVKSMLGLPPNAGLMDIWNRFQEMNAPGGGAGGDEEGDDAET